MYTILEEFKSTHFYRNTDILLKLFGYPIMSPLLKCHLLFTAHVFVY